MKKTVAIYFSDPGIYDYPFDNIRYLNPYKDIINQVVAKGVRVVIVRADSYQGKGVFREYSEFINDDIFAVHEPIKVDCIFNRDHANSIPRIEDCLVINHPDIDELCIDKYTTATIFPSISPQTCYTHSYEQAVSSIAGWKLKKGELVVLKKNYQHAGKGVYILPESDVTPDLYDSWDDILIQSFKDSKAGIPGIVEGCHDIRIYVVNKKPVVAMIRTPKAGTLIANVARGGSSFTLDINEVDSKVMSHLNIIQNVINQKGPSLYAADFLRAQDGKYYLLELNSRPAVPNPEWMQYNKVRDAFVNLLVDAVIY